MPTLVVIGGPNGSGKTTLTSYLIQKGRIKRVLLILMKLLLGSLAVMISISKRLKLLYRDEKKLYLKIPITLLKLPFQEIQKLTKFWLQNLLVIKRYCIMLLWSRCWIM